MRLKIFFILIAAFNHCISYAQDSLYDKKIQRKLTEESIITDSMGLRYPYKIWRTMVQSGDYYALPADASKKNTTYILKRATVKHLPDRSDLGERPKGSRFFSTGEKIEGFTTIDIDSARIDLDALRGKIVVLNFWFISCSPCRKEMPDLNMLANLYAKDSNVVFIAITIDGDVAIKDFLKTNVFEYQIIGDGRGIASIYGVSTFPTNVIIDTQGKVAYHSSGYSPNTLAWMQETIDKIKPVVMPKMLPE